MTGVRARWAVRVVFLAALVVAAGCQAPVIGVRPSPSPSQSVSTSEDERLQAADKKLYAGDYVGAETAYRSLASAGVRDAAAHLSTLLAYENRLGEAVSEAQAAVTAHADSDSLARLARALDWNQDLGGAVEAGARAVAARPVEPLAHAFYAEALADSGRFTDAVRELRRAEAMGGDAYAQAEVDREWGNYYRDLGDTLSELNYDELALKAQPSFAERQLDVIRFDYANQRPDNARTLADKMLAAHGRNYRLLIAVADVALAAGDVQRAPALYRAATQAEPNGVEAPLGLAEVDVAVSRDFNSAHDLLVPAVRQNPGSAAAYQYLRYLDLLVLKKDPAADLGSIAQPPDVAAEAAAATRQVNSYRSALGLPAVQQDAGLVQAAEEHAYFYLFNIGQQQLSGTGIDSEDATLPGYTAADPLSRARHFGYGGSRAGELTDQMPSPAGSVQDWVGSVFHRYPVLDPETTAAGYGLAAVGAIRLSVLDLGANQPGTADPVVYPSSGQAGVPTGYVNPEVPNPLPQGAVLPAGYPITLQLGDAQKLTVSSGRLLGPDGREVASYVLTPGNPVTAAEWALVPRAPLTPGATYTVDVAGTIDGTSFTKRWSFKAAGG